jgi:hypothetical protein
MDISDETIMTDETYPLVKSPCIPYPVVSPLAQASFPFKEAVAPSFHWCVNQVYL